MRDEIAGSGWPVVETNYPRRPRWRRLAFLMATTVWVAAWVQLMTVALLQPPPWQQLTWLTPAGSPSADQNGLVCYGNTVHRGTMVLRWPCEEPNRTGQIYGVVVDLAARTATARWPIIGTMGPSLRPLALAVGPGDDLALLVDGTRQLFRLQQDGQVVDLGVPPGLLGARLLGLAWEGQRLDVAMVLENGHRVVSYQEPMGWGRPRDLNLPGVCGQRGVCAALAAWPAVDGWLVLYGRAPERPAIPQEVVADLFLVDLDGRVQPSGSIGLRRYQPDNRLSPRSSGHYSLTSDGLLSWRWNSVDRSPGNVINDAGYGTTLRPLPDGSLVEIPPPPRAALLSISAPDRAEFLDGNPLCTTYSIEHNHLVWQPLVTRSGAFASDLRAILVADHWVVMRQTDRSLALEEWSTDASSRLRRQGPVILNITPDTAPFDCVVAPLIPAADGGFWLFDRSGRYLQMDANLHRTDSLALLQRLDLFFTAFGRGTNAFHLEWPWLKQAAILVALFGWPTVLVARVAWSFGRRLDTGRWVPIEWIVVALVMSLLAWPWFYTAIGYF